MGWKRQGLPGCKAATSCAKKGEGLNQLNFGGAAGTDSLENRTNARPLKGPASVLASSNRSTCGGWIVLLSAKAAGARQRASKRTKRRGNMDGPGEGLDASSIKIISR